MTNGKPGPLRASFRLTRQEKRSVLAICLLVLLGIAARYFYLKNEMPEVYTPTGIGQED